MDADLKKIDLPGMANLMANLPCTQLSATSVHDTSTSIFYFLYLLFIGRGAVALSAFPINQLYMRIYSCDC